MKVHTKDDEPVGSGAPVRKKCFCCIGRCIALGSTFGLVLGVLASVPRARENQYKFNLSLLRSPHTSTLSTGCAVGMGGVLGLYVHLNDRNLPLADSPYNQLIQPFPVLTFSPTGAVSGILGGFLSSTYIRFIGGPAYPFKRGLGIALPLYTAFGAILLPGLFYRTIILSVLGDVCLDEP
eukprot:TRINITY_DN158_c1_g1_i1.p1 TRINITY_DN158_c1_g1~~TRINITY_DN158_c1_g1_i1.p1  ORF type:complete len:180 (-),score=18.04 TRINITY_DN158_c1_g1_i1:100-639(-)